MLCKICLCVMNNVVDTIPDTAVSVSKPPPHHSPFHNYLFCRKRVLEPKVRLEESRSEKYPSQRHRCGTEILDAYYCSDVSCNRPPAYSFELLHHHYSKPYLKMKFTGLFCLFSVATAWQPFAPISRRAAVAVRSEEGETGVLMLVQVMIRNPISSVSNEEVLWRSSFT